MAGRLAKVLIETAKDMRGTGLIDEAIYAGIITRHAKAGA
jgi:hypothetical protein